MVSKVWMQASFAATKLAEGVQHQNKSRESTQTQGKMQSIRKHQQLRNSSVRPVRSGEGEDMVNLAGRVEDATERPKRRVAQAKKGRYLRGLPQEGAEEGDAAERVISQIRKGGHLDIKS